MRVPIATTQWLTSLEARGWVQRTPSQDDRRGQVAALTDNGQHALAAAAPGHLAQVRRLVFDQLSGSDVEHLQRLASTLLAGLTTHQGSGDQDPAPA